MKIVQTSQVYFGKSFSDSRLPGDKLRAGTKSIFSGIVDTALKESADLVILAGDTFDSTDVSQNLIDFFLGEVKRLEKIPVVIIPGLQDCYDKKSFWEQWRVSPPAENLKVIAGDEKTRVELPDHSAVVYGFSPAGEELRAPDLGNVPYVGGHDLHIGVVYGHLSTENDAAKDKLLLKYDQLQSSRFDYIALGGHVSARSFVELGLKAAYAGSPALLLPEWNDAGKITIVNLQKGSLNIEQHEVEGFVWKKAEIDMATVANMDDLKRRIMEMSGRNILLRLSLTGLALLEAGLNLEQIRGELDEHFLNLEIVDRTRVLPDNISEVKVHEKTILGQYLKVMVDKLNQVAGEEKEKMEESLKIGYTLLSGREIW
jgi:exonuclease SbcD